MRKYEPIWQKLKADGEAVIVAPVSSHQTIINMVKKEKCKDYSFKLLCSEKHTGYNLKAVTDKQKETLTFTLIRVYKTNLGNL